MPQRTGKVVFKKILADQFLGAPFFAVTFFLGAGLLEGHTLAESWKEFKEKFPAVYAVSCIFTGTSTDLLFLPSFLFFPWLMLFSFSLSLSSYSVWGAEVFLQPAFPTH